MLGRNDSESVEPLGGRLGAVCTAKASGISRKAVKSGCACYWGGWGRLSVDGPEQNNPVWSEGPWGRVAAAARTEVLQRTTSPGTERGTDEGCGEHEGQWQTVRGEEASNGRALSDLPALKPYWGKPAVRKRDQEKQVCSVGDRPTEARVRILSIPSIRDRVVQGALKLIREPIFEADFQAGSYGYRPKRTAHEATNRVAQAIIE
jgi:hypothetical protein